MIDEPFPFEKVFGSIAGFMFYATIINGCNSVEMAIVLTGVCLLILYLIFGAPRRWERRQRKKRKKKDE